MTPEYGRALRGQRVLASRPSNWTDNALVTLIGALARDGLRTMMTITGGTTGPVFLVFVKEFLVPTLLPGDVVVMDNLSAHKVAGVREAIENADAELVYLPPYSPDFNPIESCWSKLKALIRKLNPRTRTQLDGAIVSAMANVRTTDISGWFKRAGYAL